MTVCSAAVTPGSPLPGCGAPRRRWPPTPYLVYWLNRTFATGVPTSLIDPGYVKTDMVKGLGGPLAALAKLDFLSMEPEESARGISEFIARIDPEEADGRAFRKTRPLRGTHKVANGSETFRVLWQRSYALCDVDPDWPRR